MATVTLRVSDLKADVEPRRPFAPPLRVTDESVARREDLIRAIFDVPVADDRQPAEPTRAPSIAA